jgi:serine/threonine protein phosphatase PrpC
LKKNSTKSFSNNKLVDVTFQSDSINNNYFNDLNSINQNKSEKNFNDINNNDNIINKYFQDLNKIQTQNQDKNIRKITKETENIKYFQEILKTNKVISNEEENFNIVGFSAYLYKNKNLINENKICININFEKQNSKINIISLYDGHNGYQTSKYLKENLNKEILSSNNLTTDTTSTLFNSIQKMENNLYNIFLQTKNKNNKNKNNENIHPQSSGSSLLIYLEINNEIFITNLGDSFSFLSLNHSNAISLLNQSHSIANANELERVKLNGGEITSKNNNLAINPGALTVTRSIGDIESKFPQFGGKINVISNRPDIVSFKIKNEMDFIFLSNKEINNFLNAKEFCVIVYETMKNVLNKKKTFKIFLENVIINVMKYAIFKGAKNNLNCIFICFNNLKKLFYSCLNNEKIINDIIVTLNLSNKNFNNFYEELNEKKILSFNNSTNFNSDNQSYFNKFNINEKNSLSLNSNINNKFNIKNNNKVIHKIKVKKKNRKIFCCCL